MQKSPPKNHSFDPFEEEKTSFQPAQLAEQEEEERKIVEEIQKDLPKKEQKFDSKVAEDGYIENRMIVTFTTIQIPVD